MSASPIEAVLARLPDATPNGRDRWRCACPVCGGRNRSTLSIGAGDTGAVLLRCWKSGCTTDQIVGALGLELTDLFPKRVAPGHGSAPIKRRRLLTAVQALELLEGEMLLSQVCSGDMARGVPLSSETRERLLRGAARVALLRDEVRA